MASKRGVGTQGVKTEQMLTTNVYGLFPLEAKPIYRYEVAITGWTHSDRPVEFSGKISNE